MCHSNTGATLAIASISAFFSSIVSLGSPLSVYIVVAIFRFLLGVGVGGVYPLSAAKAAEDSGSATTGKVNVAAAAWAFLWQIPGSMTPWLLGYFFTFSETMSTELKWRLILGLGAIPAALVCCLTGYEDYLKEREKAAANATQTNSIQGNIAQNPMVEECDTSLQHSTTLFTQIQSNVLEGSSSVHNSFKGSFSKSRNSIIGPKLGENTNDAVRIALGQTEFRRKLIVTGGCWFLYDICVYGVALFSGAIISALLPTSDDVSSDQHIRSIASLQLIAQSFGFPAIILSILVLPYTNTRHMQMFGFAMIAIAFIFLASLFHSKSTVSVFSCYVFLYFWLQGGAGVSTFILPAQVYPTEIRSTFNGVSAAMGKSGAFVGSFLFGVIATASSFVTVMIMCACLCGVGIIVTYYFLDPPEVDDPSPTTASDL